MDKVLVEIWKVINSHRIDNQLDDENFDDKLDDILTDLEEDIAIHFKDQKRTYKMIDKDTRKEIKEGDEVQSDNETYIVTGFSVGRTSNSSGRIHVKIKGEIDGCSYYPSVFNARIIETKE